MQKKLWMASSNCLRTDLAKNNPQSKETKNITASGISVSAGIVMGRALFVGRDLGTAKEIVLNAQEAKEEVRRFREALDKSRQQLAELRKQVGDIIGEQDAQIFDAHLLIMDDDNLIKEIKEKIVNEGRNAEFIFEKVIERYTNALRKVSDPYIRDRIADIQDVANRIIGNLRGEVTTDVSKLTEPRIIVAHDLSPSDTVTMTKDTVLGFVTRIGSRTSHTAIIARALQLPAVVGMAEAFDQIHNDDMLILDALRGTVLIDPDEQTIENYKKKIADQEKWFAMLESELALPTETRDGFRVQLAANIELPEEVEHIRQSFGVGIGLFRSEYLFLNQELMPTEEEQFQTYRQLAEKIYPQSVIIRTLDIGGDKFLSSSRFGNEINPFLGMRAIRLSLSTPASFKIQLRAILRASAFGKVRIMFPLISTLEEIQTALEYLDEARQELDAEEIPYHRHMDIGIMIEVPAAALLADKLAPYVDFFSVGTNDLIQYSLAVDRANPEIAYLYQPTHPSIIHLLQNVVHVAYEHGKWVSICGEMGGDTSLVPLILGLGIHELSMSSVSLPMVKRLIRRIRMYDAENLVRHAQQCGTAKEVQKLCDNFVQEFVPDLFPRQ